MRNLYQKIKDKLENNISLLITFFLVLLFFIVYLFNNIVYTIYPGQAGILYSRFFGGTIIDKVYPEGIHLILPWDKMYIYNVRVQEVPYEFDVLSKNGLKIHLKISIRYYPEYDVLGLLHQKVGPDYVNKVVIPEIESVLRIIIGRIEAEEVYKTETSLIETSINEAIEQVSQKYIKVDDVIIKRIELPDSVEQSIRYKIQQKHLAEAHKFKIERAIREAERKRIEARGLRDYNRIVSSSLSNPVLQWKAIQATLELSNSKNSKVVVAGGGRGGLPILGSLILDAPYNTPFTPDPGESDLTNTQDFSQTQKEETFPDEMSSLEEDDLKLLENPLQEPKDKTELSASEDSMTQQPSEPTENAQTEEEASVAVESNKNAQVEEEKAASKTVESNENAQTEVQGSDQTKESTQGTVPENETQNLNSSEETEQNTIQPTPGSQTRTE